MTMGRGMARAVRDFLHSTQGIVRMTLESSRRVLVTGATGLLGSHLAEQLRQRGHAVRALVRPTSRTDFLKSLGVELVEGDLTNPDDCARAVDGVEHVFHSAAKVGDWGKWDEFQVGCIDATRTLAVASAKAGVSRFLHISSTSAYGHPHDQETPIDESAPLGQNVWYWDPYTWSKVECEQLLWGLTRTDGLALTVIRPSWLFGERDRTTIPRLLPAFRAGKVLIVGPGDNPLSAVYAGTVADAAILAAEDPDSRGEAYNITSHGPITQRGFLDMIADAALVAECDRPQQGVDCAVAAEDRHNAAVVDAVGDDAIDHRREERGAGQGEEELGSCGDQGSVPLEVRGPTSGRTRRARSRSTDLP